MSRPSYRHLNRLIKKADKLHDFLMNPKSRPDLQTPEAQEWFRHLEKIHNDKTDPLMPWLTREWKKGRVKPAYGAAISFAKGTGIGEQTDLRVRHPQHLDHWGDFLNSNHPLRREMGDIMQHDIHSFDDRINAWNEDLANKATQQEAEEAAKGGERVHEWPDGWSIRRLHTPEELKSEGNVMGHCVGGYHPSVAQGRTSIYSLRDPEGQPHVTTEIRPKYVEDEAGHRHKMEHLEGPLSSHEVMPHQGEVEQIQGKANREPNPEYKQRMREWFESFPPEERPKFRQEDYDLNDIGEIEPHHFKPTKEGEVDEYGLHVPPRMVNWDDMLDDFEEEPRYSEYKLNHNDVHTVYDLAKARGEIPQLGHAFKGLSESVQDNLQKIQENNWDWHHENVGPHPEMREEELGQMTPEERQEEAESQPYRDEHYHNEYEWPWDQKKKEEAENDYNHREEYAWKELENEDYGAQHVQNFRELLKPHQNPRTGEYTNELPYAFSSWSI